MSLVVQDFVIPAGEGRGFEVRRGQRLQVVAEEGPQAADLIAFNAHDHGEVLSTWLTRHLSHSFRMAENVYTALPDANLMFAIRNPRPGLLWLEPGRCNRLSYLPDHSGHNNCQQILEGVVAQWGMRPRQVPEVFNIFMDVRLREDGTYEFLPSPVEPGDYVEMLAHMDCLVGVTACPDDLSAYNGYRAKPLRIRILEDRHGASSG